MGEAVEDVPGHREVGHAGKAFGVDDFGGMEATGGQEQPREGDGDAGARPLAGWPVGVPNPTLHLCVTQLRYFHFLVVPTRQRWFLLQAKFP